MYDAEVRLSAAAGVVLALAVLLGSPVRARAEAPSDTLLVDRPLALYPLQPEDGLDRTAAGALDERLRQILKTNLGVTLFSRNDTAAMLRPEGGRLGLSCDDGAQRCLADLGRLLGARKVIFGRVGPQQISLKLVDVETGGEERRAEESGLPVTDLIEAASVHLLAPKRYLGSIAVTAPAGARVAVDGTAVGTAPLPPLAVVPGQHLVTASVAGGPDLLSTVDVRYGQTTRADVRAAAAESGPPRELSRWGIGFLIGAAALTTAGIVTGIISQQNRYAVSGMAYPVPQSDAALVQQRLGNAHDYALAADILYVTAGAAAITGVILLLTDHPGNNVSGTVTVTPSGAGVQF